MGCSDRRDYVLGLILRTTAVQLRESDEIYLLNDFHILNKKLSTGFAFVWNGVSIRNEKPAEAGLKFKFGFKSADAYLQRLFETDREIHGLTA